MVFCNSVRANPIIRDTNVTILILIDGFLQYLFFNGVICAGVSHNPYFNRWFSAIDIAKTLLDLQEKSQSLF